MEIGKILRETREAKNISLESLQETTKIQKRYLIAIEEGNFHILPGTFYARAFIKEYATAVGLDPDELISAHQDELPAQENKNTMEYTRLSRSSRRRSPSKSPVIFSILPTIIVLLLIVAIIFVGWTLYQQSNLKDDGNKGLGNQGNSDELIRNENRQDPTNQNEGNSENEEKEENEENNEQMIDEPVAELRLVEAGTGQKPESVFELINVDDHITLVFEPTGASWLDIENGDRKRLYAVTTKDGETLEYVVENEESIRINIGFAPALPIIKINDIEIEYPHDPNKFHTQRFWIHKEQQDES